MRFSVADQVADEGGLVLPRSRSSQGASVSTPSLSPPFVFSLKEPEVSFVEGRSTDVTPPVKHHQQSLRGTASPQKRKEFEKELQYADQYRRANAVAWFDSNVRREKLNKELKEVFLEESQDLKSSIFSVLDQKASYEEDISKFVGVKRKSTESPQIRALGNSLQVVQNEIHKAKHQKLLEEAKLEEARQAAEQRKLEEAKQKALEDQQRMQQTLARRERERQKAEEEKARRTAIEEKEKLKEKEKALQKAKEDEVRKEEEELVSPGVQTTLSAARWERTCAEVYNKHKGFASEIFKASKLERLKLEKPIKKAVNQLSCSKQQIRFVGDQMIRHLTQQHSQGQHFYSYCLVRLGDLVALQGPGLGASKQLAFAYAELASMVSSAFKDFLYVLIASLHRSCPLTVPKYPKDYTAVQTEIKGHSSLHAALMQLNPQPWFQSTDHSWSYLARFLNAMPVNEQTAIALDSFLQIAGHKTYLTFRKQQLKVYTHIKEVFLTALDQEQAKGAEDDVDAVKSRIEKYVQDQHYLNAPEGSFIPETDDSSHIRC